MDIPKYIMSVLSERMQQLRSQWIDFREILYLEYLLKSVDTYSISAEVE
jgi:hypothetical protein